MRNRPMLDVIATVAHEKPKGTTVNIASIGCSDGAELYSLLYLLRSGRDELQIEATGVDISSAIVARARGARFQRNAVELAQLSNAEITEIFVAQNDWVKVRDWVREGTRWITADARDSMLVERVGTQNIVLANNFLGPMSDAEAELCLVNIMNIIEPGGHLVIAGIDLDLKSRFVRRLGLKPILTHLDEIHVADWTKRGWPWIWWALEPIDRERSDWEHRYSKVFQVP